MSKSNTNYQPVYTLRIAMELQSRGHMPCNTMPNPKKPEFLVWVFKATPEFIADFEEITKEA